LPRSSSDSISCSDESIVTSVIRVRLPFPLFFLCLDCINQLIFFLLSFRAFQTARLAAARVRAFRNMVGHRSVPVDRFGSKKKWQDG
jgi:hypothetical protein